MTSIDQSITELSQHFFELTPEKVLAAVESAGFRCTGRVLPLNSMENRVYEVEIELPGDLPPPVPSDGFRVAKFYRPGRWSEEQIREEHEFLANLTAADIPVVPPVHLPNGTTYGRVPELEIFFSIFPKQGGRMLDELSPELALRLGRLLARVHSVGAAQQAYHRLRLDPNNYGRANLGYLLDTDVLPPEVRSAYRALVEKICARSEPWFRAAAYQRIHGDVHFGNILSGREALALVDFDDMVVGPPVQDLWLLIPGSDDERIRFQNLLLEGYEEFAPFDHSTLRLIEPLRALRYIHFSAWIARRWDDPSFPRTFPYFGTADYWRGQLHDLEEQWEKIDALS